MSIYCSLAFNAISIAGEGYYKPCCNIDLDSFFKLDYKGGLNSPAMVNLRQTLNNNSWPTPCKNCEYVEKLGYNSMRTIFNDMFKDTHVPLNDIVDNKDILYADIFLGNKCNSKCLTCSPNSSDYWQEEFNFIHNSQSNISATQYGLDFNDCKKLIEEYPNISYISFIGGEPTIITSHLKFLYYLVSSGKSKQTNLTYNTNLTGFTEELLKLWREFKHVGISVSIDGYKKVNEYIRYPFKWNKIDSNLDKVFELKNISVGLACTLSVFNAIDIPNLFEYWYYKFLSKSDKSNPVFISAYINRVKNPDYMDINMLSLEYRNQSFKKCDILMDKIVRDQHSGSILGALNVYKSYMSEPQILNEVNTNKLKTFITRSDEFRKRNIYDYIPNLGTELNL